MEYSQSGKEILFNRTLLLLQFLASGYVIDKDLTAPPASPVDGDAYLIFAASPTGAWAGKSKNVAVFYNSEWFFIPPVQGVVAITIDDGKRYTCSGTDWAENAGVFATLGIGGATPDATNKLAVSAPGALFSHAGAGHQLKVNKNATGDTASVLFQAGFSGRAEIGLLGDDNFKMKVSSNGTTWTDAFYIDSTNGISTFQQRVDLNAGFSTNSGTDTVSAVESGTWTPTLVSSGGGTPTYSSQTGRYYRFGRFIFLTWRIQISALNTLSATSGDTLSIGGAPFANSSGTDYEASGGISLLNGLASAAGEQIIPVIASAANAISLILGGGTSGTVPLAGNKITGSFQIRASIAYLTA
jgi:hypothetical protein